MTDEREQRKQRLSKVVWSRVPKHLSAFAPSSGFRQLVDGYKPGTSHILIGPTGSGKSTACVHVVRNLLTLGADEGGEAYRFALQIFWARADDITAAGAGDGGDPELIRRARGASLLVIDDLSVSSKTLLGVLQWRFDKQRTVLITSGATSDAEFVEKAGGVAVVRWILQTGKQTGKQVWLPTGPIQKESRKK